MPSARAITTGVLVMILCLSVAAGRVSAAGLVFERNQGQTAREVKFVARHHGDVVYLTRSQAVLSLGPAGGRRAALRMSLLGTRAPRSVEGVDPLDGHAHYLIGNRAAWHRDVPTYERVRYAEIYRGVDLIYYGNHERELEYDFTVAPGANPDAIRFRFDGAERVALGQQGELQIVLDGRAITQRRPVAYQIVEGERRTVEVAYRIDKRNTVGIELGRYDHRRPLVIDPVLLFSTYLGGSGDAGASPSAIAVDPLGNTYVVGSTTALDFPTTPGAFQPDNAGGSTNCHGCDGFITKFSRTGAFVYSTYLGGLDNESVNAIAVDALGRAYVGGSTSSSDFPTTPDALLTSCALEGWCALGYGFVARLNGTGSDLDFSTLTSRRAGVTSLAVDRHGNVVVAGSLTKQLPPIIGEPPVIELPTTPGAFQRNFAGKSDAWVAKLNPTGSALLFATYFGGAEEDILRDMALDPQGNIYLIGGTQSTPDSFPLSVTALQQDCPRGTGDFSDKCFITFVAKLSADGSTLGYSTYLGGFGPPIVAITGHTSAPGAIAVDRSGYAYVTGWALSTDFPTTPGTIKPTTTTRDAFVSKLSQDGSALVYSTNLGGDISGEWDFFTGTDIGGDIQVDGAGNVYVAGATTAHDYPLAGTPIQPTLIGNRDGFLSKLNPTGSVLLESTYLDMRLNSVVPSLAVDLTGAAHVTGATIPQSQLPPGDPGIPLVNAAQTTPSTGFVAKIGDVLPFATVTANGSEGPSTLSAGRVLDVHVAFNSSPLGTIPAGEVYIGILTPTGTYWLDLPTLTFKPTMTVTYTGAVPSFGPSRLFHLDDAGSLPPGIYVPFIIVDTDTNGVPDGTDFHYSVIEIE